MEVAEEESADEYGTIEQQKGIRSHGDGQPSGGEKECTALSHHLLPRLKAAVRAAEQDAGIGPDTFGPGAVHDAY